MNLTNFNCWLFSNISSRSSLQYCLFNPNACPGNLSLAISKASKNSIGSHVAYNLAMENYNEGITKIIADNAGNGSFVNSLEIVEHAFKTANNAVYSFGHKLSAGGRMGANLFGLTIYNNQITIGRVGVGSAYLFRNNKLFPFFLCRQVNEKNSGGDNEELVRHLNRKFEENTLGTNATVSVELATVDVQEGDYVIVFTSAVNTGFENKFINNVELIFKNIKYQYSSRYNAELSSLICDCIKEKTFKENQDEEFFFFTCKIGSDALFLSSEMRI